MNAALQWVAALLYGPVAVVVLVYFTLLNLSYVALLLLARRALRDRKREGGADDFGDLLASDMVPPVSIVVPAFNEERTIVDSIAALLSMQYPQLEIIAVNDGSVDGTLQRLIETYDLRPVSRVYWRQINCAPIRGIYWSAKCPHLWVLDKENGRKADAVNAGINLAASPYVCVIDGDSLIEHDALLRLMRLILRNPDEIVAAGGAVRIVNGCRLERGRVTAVDLPASHLASLQVLEYLRAFLFGRVGWARLNSLLIVSGAFGVFRKDAVVAVGGLRHDTIGEDMDLIVRIHRNQRERRRRYQVVFSADPVCWTECPETWTSLRSQRQRWQRGLGQTLWHNRTMLFNPRYGRVGLLAMPYFLFFEYLAPVIEVVGYVALPLGWMLGLVPPATGLIFLAVAVVLGMLVSVATLLLEEGSFRRYHRPRQLLRLLGYALLENVVWRQVHAWWRLTAFLPRRRGQSAWASIPRKGFAKA